MPENYRWYSDLATVNDLTAEQRTNISTQYPAETYRYIYSNGNVYVVNRSTNTVTGQVDVTP